MSHPRLSRGNAKPRATIPLQDVALRDRESAFYASRVGDVFLLAFLIAALLGTGGYIWHQLGPENSHAGQAIFFGLALLCAIWAAILYTFKLSVSVRVGPHGISIVRGPWRTELPWREVARLVERAQVIEGQRYRWVVALARDGRRLQVREDMVGDYQRFRRETYERYRLWRDHGGTWGTTGGGPYSTREAASAQVTWWSLGAALFGLPGLYFALLLPETGPLGLILLGLATVCALLTLRAALRRQRYNIDAKAIEARQLMRTTRLAWRDIARVERSRHRFGKLMMLGIALGRFALSITARTDARVRSFAWSPRVPEYLTLRGAGHQIRIALHRLARPDELLAWVEFYQRVAQRTSVPEQPKRAVSTTRRLLHAPQPEDYSVPGAPPDPWGSGLAGDVDEATPAVHADVDAESESAWLSAEPGDHRPTPSGSFEEGVVSALQPHAEVTPDQTWHQPDAVVDPALATPTEAVPVVDASATHPLAPAVESHAGDSPLWSPTDAEPLWLGEAGAKEHWTPAVPTDEWPQENDESWLSADMEDVQADEEDMLAAEVDGFTEPLMPWQQDSTWEPPPLPRFGPPRESDQQTKAPEPPHPRGE